MARGSKSLVALAAVFALATAACGDADSTASGSSEVGSDAIARATANLAPYTGHPNAFPVDEPLKKKLGPETKLAFLQCSTPICALIGNMVKQAAASMNVPVSVTKASPSAQSLQEAMSSIIAAKPQGVLIPATDPVQFRDPMEQLAKLDIPVVSQGVVNAQDFKAIKGSILGQDTAVKVGTLLADWTVKRNGNAPSVFYATPELSFTKFIQQGYTTELKALCPSCKVRVVQVPISTIGNKAPQTVVSDLQANPDTKTAVFSSEESATGLPAALKVAGITVDTVGFAPDPAVLGYIKNGDITAGLGFDIRTSAWIQLDMTARLLTGQPLTSQEAADPSVLQMLEQKDVNFDPSHGFNGYPDVADRFAKLWPAS